MAYKARSFTKEYQNYKNMKIESNIVWVKKKTLVARCRLDNNKMPVLTYLNHQVFTLKHNT